MKASYMLPSGTYNLMLSKDDLQKLLKTGLLSIRISRCPCVTGRAVWNPEKEDLETLDRKEIFNNLCFCLDETVADVEEGFHNVQFLNIHIEQEKTDE